MVTTKKSKKKTTKKGGTKRASARSGAVPPYGEVIRGAIAGGDVLEMRKAAGSARKWISDVQAALAQLDSAIKKSGS